MQAFFMDRYGAPSVMRLGERPAPTVGPRDVRIAVKAASLNPLDWKIRAGKVKAVMKPPLPMILGCDVAGVIDQVGAEVAGWKVGDEVCARLEKTRMGALAEYVAADASVLARRPRRGGWAEAAAIPLAGLTALQALREVADVQPGQRVLIHAGAGGVGSLAIQIAKRLGAWVATTCSASNAALVTSLGADQAIDYTRGPIADHVRDLDAVLDTLGGASEMTSLGLCKPGGVVIGVSGLPDADFARAHLAAPLRPLIWLATGKRRRAAARLGVRYRYLYMRPDGDQLAELARWVDDGSLRPLIHKTFPLAEAAAAFAELERGRARGKIVVTVGA